MFLAAKRFIHAYGIVFFGHESEKPAGVEILESIDLFLVDFISNIFTGIGKDIPGKTRR